VLDEFRHPSVRKAGGKALDEADSPIRRSEKQAACVRRDPAAIEIDRHPPPFDRSKQIAIRATPSVRIPEPFFCAQVVLAKQFSLIRSPMHVFSARYPG
jgi:hypothetical protein